MNDYWLKIKVWTKISIFAILALFGLIFLIKNDSRPVDVWFVHDYSTTVLRLLLLTFIFGIVVTLLARTTFRTLRQITDLRERNRLQRMERDLAQQMRAVPEAKNPAPMP